jgi:hypothetical protein
MASGNTSTAAPKPGPDFAGDPNSISASSPTDSAVAPDDSSSGVGLLSSSPFGDSYSVADSGDGSPVGGAITPTDSYWVSEDLPVASMS